MKVLVLLAAILPYISCQMPGAPTIFYPNLTDPCVVSAVEAINDMYESQGDNRHRTAVDIVFATRQIVEGIKYVLDIEITGGDGNAICTVREWSRSWFNETQTQGSPECVPKVPVLAVIVPYISRQVVGGANDNYKTDLSDPLVVFAVEAIIKTFRSRNYSGTITAIALKHSTAQALLGVYYTFKIEVAGGGQSTDCTVRVWSRPWLNDSAEATQLGGTPQCGAWGASPDPPSVLGGQVPTNLSDPETKNAYQFVETSVNAMSNESFYVIATNFTSITKQLVNGVIYRFTGLVFSPTNCTNPLTIDVPVTSCHVDSDTPLMTCDYRVYWNSRETPEYVLQKEQCP